MVLLGQASWKWAGLAALLHTCSGTPLLPLWDADAFGAPIEETARCALNLRLRVVLMRGLRTVCLVACARFSIQPQSLVWRGRIERSECLGMPAHTCIHAMLNSCRGTGHPICNQGPDGRELRGSSLCESILAVCLPGQENAGLDTQRNLYVVQLKSMTLESEVHGNSKAFGIFTGGTFGVTSTPHSIMRLDGCSA